MYRITEVPLASRGGSIYPYTSQLAQVCTFESTYENEEPIRAYRTVPYKGTQLIEVPRTFTDVGGKDLRVEGKEWAAMSNFVPRSQEQKRVIDESVDLLRFGTSHVLQAPTGFGKTYVGTEILQRIGRRALIIVTKQDLADQWRAACHDILGVEPGIVQGDKVDIHPWITIGMVQSLSLWDRYPRKLYEQFGVVLVDETHRIGADHFQNAMFNLPGRLRLGMSATPYRKDGRDVVIQGHIGNVMVKSDAQTLPFTVLRWTTDVNCHSAYHDFGRTMGLVGFLAKSQKRNQGIAKFCKKAWEQGRTVIVFSDTIKHLDIMRKTTIANGVPEDATSKYVGGLKKAAREEAQKKPIIFATYKYCSEGTDIPHADTCVLATPKADVIQIVGRILRDVPGKKEPVVLDVVDHGSEVIDAYYSKRHKFYISRQAAVKPVEL